MNMEVCDLVHSWSFLNCFLAAHVTAFIDKFLQSNSKQVTIGCVFKTCTLNELCLQVCPYLPMAPIRQ